MRLTRCKAIEISIELWTWLAESGVWSKLDWSRWKEYGYMDCDCPLCEYTRVAGGSHNCLKCPYYKKFGFCWGDNTIWVRWNFAETKKARKKYASQFLEQLRSLK